jgi:CheY-like chemotaxis protein
MKLKAVVADDNPDLLEAVSLELETLGLEVARAMSGAELLDLVANAGPFGLIVTDINMPWMDGLQVTRSVRNAGLTTPILVMTGHLEKQAAVQGVNVALLLKPFSAEALHLAVHGLVPGLATS